MALTIDELATFCRKKGFVFPSGELYNGIGGFWDYGPLGVDMKNNLKNHWWKRFVTTRDDVVGIDGAVITHPRVWVASQHVTSFTDMIVSCAKCGQSNRADQLPDTNFEGMNIEEVQHEITKKQINCPSCKTPYTKVESFNLMFSVHVGPSGSKSTTAYLRPETAQLIFANFKNIINTQRVKLPFGIAQTGKAFRNEISPRDFLFRSREFEQMEIEYFTHPDKRNECPEFENIKNTSVEALLSQDEHTQETDVQSKTWGWLVENQHLTQWHAYWLSETLHWFHDLGIKPENLRLREHMKTELAHYADACFDIEYHFPFGWKEIHGCASRGQFDLTQHQIVSAKDLTMFDEESKSKVLPAVAAEPSQGVDRALLALLCDGYEDNKERGNVVLRIHPLLAPVQVGVFPLVNKVNAKAEEVYELIKHDFAAFYDKGGSIGRRYARSDEMGVPYCITVDFDTEQDQKVTIRNRDTTEQKRVLIDNLSEVLKKLLAQPETFASL